MAKKDLIVWTTSDEDEVLQDLLTEIPGTYYPCKEDFDEAWGEGQIPNILRITITVEPR